MFICNECNKEFISTNKYHNFSYCSRSCATKAVRGSLTAEKLELEIIKFVTQEGRYCNTVEISKGIHRSTKTFTQYGISIVRIQEKLGFKKNGSLFEQSVYLELTKLFGTVSREVTFDDLLSPKGYPLRIDFYIPSMNLFVEADGYQHNDPNNPWYNEYNVECDTIKTNYCNSKGVLIRLPYTKNVNTKYIKKHLRAI